MAAEEKAEADSGVSLAASAAIPVTPPKTKLLGNLKKYTPTDMMEMLSVINAYCLTYSMILFRMEDSAFVSIKFTAQYSFLCSAAQTDRLYRKYCNTERPGVKGKFHTRRLLRVKTVNSTKILPQISAVLPSGTVPSFLDAPPIVHYNKIRMEWYFPPKPKESAMALIPHCSFP